MNTPQSPVVPGVRRVIAALAVLATVAGRLGRACLGTGARRRIRTRPAPRPLRQGDGQRREQRDRRVPGSRGDRPLLDRSQARTRRPPRRTERRRGREPFRGDRRRHLRAAEPRLPSGRRARRPLLRRRVPLGAQQLRPERPQPLPAPRRTDGPRAARSTPTSTPPRPGTSRGATRASRSGSSTPASHRPTRTSLRTSGTTSTRSPPTTSTTTATAARTTSTAGTSSRTAAAAPTPATARLTTRTRTAPTSRARSAPRATTASAPPASTGTSR